MQIAAEVRALLRADERLFFPSFYIHAAWLRDILTSASVRLYSTCQEG